MKKTKKVLALVLAMVLCMSIGMPAFAAPSAPSITIEASSTQEEGEADTTSYTWYRIFEADIAEDPTSQGATQSGGKVSYYVDSQAKATAIEGTGLFNVVRVGTENKWYVELKDAATSAETIGEKFAAMDKSAFATGTFAQTAVGGTATTGQVDPGYYFITSTAGTNVVIQTLTAVTIEEKNTYPPVGKTVDATDKNVQIGDEVSYTLTVQVPGTANAQIVLTDTMTAGLTFKAIASVKNDAGANVPYTLAPAAPAETDKQFTITFDADTVKANKGKTITVEYTAVVNKDAQIETAEKNTVKLDYGNNYTSKPKEVEIKTYKFTFDKVDGDDTSKKLTGAEFELQLNGTSLDLVEVEAGKTYRIATDKDTTKTKKIKTNGNTVTINGLDTDVTYSLLETKAPTGFNKLAAPVEVKATDNAFVHQNIENNKGSVLPSTGGMGTTMFYVIGSVLVIGAVVLLVSKRRMSDR